MANKRTFISELDWLMQDWHWEKNVGLDPNQLTVGSHKKVWWKCGQGHEWAATIPHRKEGTGCPYCAGKKSLKGYNDLQTVNPMLSKEWNYARNGETTPETVTSNSAKNVWWICVKGHEWQATIASRNSGRGCPYCSGRCAIKGENDLQTVNPSLANEWNYENNKELTPADVLPNSNKKVWWKCNKGHEWQATIASRNRGRGCPYCSGRYALKGENDLLTLNPTLAKEWNYEKNGRLTPIDVMPNSMTRVWWKCAKGHEWQAVINSRNSNSTGCPVCNSERHTSFPEFAIIFYLRKHGLDAMHSYKLNGYELDIYIPSKKVAIEYDGHYWHKNKANKELDKNRKCNKDGIKLYRIREGLSPLNDSSLDYIIQNARKELPMVLEKVLSEIIGIRVDVNLDRDALAIENLREYTEKENSLLLLNSQVANEWDYEKNGNLMPWYFTSGSGRKVWWKCSKGHEWQATINSRNSGCGCPYCSGKKVLNGYNDLQTVNLSLAMEWNYEMNNGLTPSDIMPNSNKKVWWKCGKGHEWQSSICNRNKGRGCPYCANQKVLKGYNDLLTTNPELAGQWNLEKNGNLKPEQFTAGSSRKVWWKCGKGHEWKTAIVNRVKGHNCPYCSGRYAIKGENDLQTVNPALSAEWNYDKNNGLMPDEVTPGSEKKVWWKCSQGHEWQATISSRNNGCGCPQCYKEKRKKKK